MTIAERPVEQSDERADQLTFRWPPILRLFVAVIISGAATLSLALAIPRQLRVATDIVGYPTYANFNIERILDLYYLGILFFPFCTLALFLGQTWVGRRLGLIGRPSAAVQVASEVEAPETNQRVMVVGLTRALAVGASLGLEVAVVAGATGRNFWLTLAVVALAYSAWLLGIARLRARHDLTTEIARANALVAPLAVLGLWAVSASTTVTVASDGSVHHYPWLPWWVAILLFGAAFAWIWTRLSAASGEWAVRAVERRTVLFLTAPVSLFLLLSGLPGDRGPLDVFHEGEALVAARLTAAGSFYWRDLLSTHGFLQDVAMALVGLRLFEDSRWGFWAGITVLVTPIAYVSFFGLGAWLFERSWAFVTAFLVLLLSVLGVSRISVDYRFVFWPLILLLLAAALQRRRGWISAALGACLAAQAILVPESAYCVTAGGAIVFLHDLYHRSGPSLVATFSKTLWLTAGGVGLFAVFSLFLLSHHAFGDFFFYYQVFAAGHELTGALPIHLRANGKFFVIVQLAPVAALLLGFLYYAVKVIGRRPLDVRDWVVGASALFALPYYTKFLERADVGHGQQAYGAAFPLIAFLVYRACTYVDRAIGRSSAWQRSGGRLTGQPVAALLLVGVLAAVMPSTVPNMGTPVAAWLATTPDHYHVVFSTPPESKSVGYSSNAIDMATVTDLDRVFKAYLRPGDWVFDFSNEPALIYYLIGQNPHTRYYHATMALAERAQKDLIAELERDPPKLVVFSDNTYGLLNWDGIPNMVRHYEVSQYILDHYKPLLSTHTQIIYGLATAQLSPADAMNLPLQEPVRTEDLPFQGFNCDWGYVPNFLSISPPPSKNSVAQVTLATQAVSYAVITFFGWAGDLTTGQPARQVVATAGGEVVGQTVPGLSRPDVAASSGRPDFAKSGYYLYAKVPDRLLSDPSGMASIAVYGISARGVASRIDNPAPGSPQVSQIKLDDGTLIPVRPGEVTGWVDYVTPSHQLAISPPAGALWSDYRWLEIDSASDFGQDSWVLYDKVSGDPGRQIIFRTLGSTKTLRVFVGSCAQWHGYAAVPLMLGYSLPQDIAAVRLLP